MRREEHVYVAAGMDILLSVGAALVRIDKQAEDAQAAAASAA